MNKKILSIILCAALFFTVLPSAFAEQFTVEDAFDECSAQYPDFVAKLEGAGATRARMVSFLSSLQRYLQDVNENEHTITEETFEDDLIAAIKVVINYRSNLPVQDALLDAYPDAVIYTAAHNSIHSDFIPLFETVRSMIFTHNMLDPDGGEDDTKTITAIASVDAGSVAYGTAFSDVGLPETVSATLSDGSKVDLVVSWSSRTYSATSAGEQNISGTALTDGYDLAGGVTASVTATVTVREQEIDNSTVITAIDGANALSVAYATAFEDVPLPKTLTAHLANAATAEISVTWNAGDYSATKTGAQNIGGTADTAGYTLANGVTSAVSATVTVLEREDPIDYTHIITGIKSVNLGSVKYNTPFDDANFPETVTAILASNGSIELNVTWNADEYSAAKSGIQTVSGTVDVTGYTLYSGLEAQAAATVIVLEEEKPGGGSGTGSGGTGSGGTSGGTDSTDYSHLIVGIETAYIGNVIYNTVVTNIGFPETVTAALGDNKTVDLAVTWNTDEYDPTFAGTQTISGSVNTEGYTLYEGVTANASAVLTVLEEDMDYERGEGEYNGNITVPDKPDDPKTDEISFSDLDKAAWAKESILSLAKSGIINGYSDGTFKPNNNITRAEFATIIVRASGAMDETAAADFSDVKVGDWFYASVAQAKKAGYINGYTDGTFLPNATISRGDISLIVYRYLLSKGVTVEIDYSTLFTDDAAIPSYSREAIYAMKTLGIINGFEDGSFGARQNATRAQAAKILDLALKTIE